MSAQDIALVMLKRHEGLRQKPYNCPRGFLTIGYGRNIEARGISRQEAEYLLSNDIDEAIDFLQKQHYWYGLNDARKAVLIDMLVNMGIPTFSMFKKFAIALDKQDYNAAAKEMRASIWFKQVPNRANELMQIMAAGVIEE